MEAEFVSWLLRQITVYASLVCFVLGFVKAGWMQNGKRFIPDWKSAGIFFFLVAWTVLA